MLQAGFLIRLLLQQDVSMRGSGPKRACRCLFHDDRHASAFVSEDNIYFCSVCTPEGGWSAKTVCEKLGIRWEDALGKLPLVRTWTAPLPDTPSFTAADAQRVWTRAYACARDDEQVGATRATLAYLARRNLIEGFELGAYGVLRSGPDLPSQVSKWPNDGYSLIAPLFDATGTVVNVQARSITGSEPKTLFPTGSRASGTVFASTGGLNVLHGTPGKVLYGEGLTDHIALTIASPVAVLCAPGTPMAASGVGAWAKDCTVYIALDGDAAGEAAVAATARAAHQRGAARVARLRWPDGAKDACDVVDRIGIDGLAQFLRSEVA